MKKKTLFTVALLGFVTICLAAAAGLAGKWKGTVVVPDGTNVDLTYNFKIDGDKLTGSAESQGREVTIDSGKVSGNEFKFSVTNHDGVLIPHKGKYFAAGDSCSLDLDFQGTMFHTTLKRLDK